MPQFFFAYLDGKKPESPQQGAESMAKWQAWVKDLGTAMINPGTPMNNTKYVNNEGVSDDIGAPEMSGFSIVEAADMDAALAIAKNCPFLEMGTIQVAQTMQMPG